MTPAVLITGGTGYLAQGVARRYLETTSLDVVLAARAPAPGLLAGPRVGWVEADLTRRAPFGCLPAGERDRIVQLVHAAAATRFNVDRATAVAVNVEGTARALELAAGCPNLASFGYLSTVYASGLGAGVVAEAPLGAPPGFANEYERSKWEAEQLVEAAGLPARVLRVATVVAAGDAGVVEQHNAVHTTLRLCFHGLLPLLPGDPSTPLYLVTADFVTAATVALMGPAGDRGGVFHLCHRRDQSVRLGRLIEVAFETFGEDGDFRRRRVMAPLLADLVSFDLMVGALGGADAGVVGQALAGVAPFARQLYVDKDVANDRLAAALGDSPAPEPEELLRRVCRHLVATRWGRHVAVA